MSTHVVTPDTGIMLVPDEQVEQIETKRDGLLLRAESLIIHDPATEAVGWAIINGIADLKKFIIEELKPAKVAAQKTHKAVCDLENKQLDNLVEPDAIVRGKLAEWDGEKKRIQAEAERVARLNAEAERRRLQAIADAEARVEQERRRVEAEEKRIQEAIAAEQAGKADVAAAILEKPIEVAPVVAAAVVIPPSVVPSAVTHKVEGAGAMVDDWVFSIVNPDLIPREYMVIDEKAIAAIVKRLKKVAEKTIPGISVENKPKPRTSARR